MARRLLIPLADLVRQLHASCLLVRHLTKNIHLDAEHRGGGSVAFPAVPRVHMLAEWHPEHNDEVGVLAQVNNNLARRAQSRIYRTIETTVEADGVEAETFAIKWDKATDLKADDLLQKRDARKADPRKQDYQQWLELVLEDGEWHLVNELQREWVAAGYTKESWRYLAERVVPTMPIQRERVFKMGKQIAWKWRLPSGEVVKL